MSLVVMLALVFGPGCIVFRIFRPRGARLECLALAPALSAGFVFLLGELGELVGFAFGPGSFAVALVLAGAAAAARRRSTEREIAEVPTGDGHRRTALAFLVVACLLTAGAWFAGMQGVATTPPSRDAANHGLMAARVAEMETLDVEQVLRADVPGDPAQTAFYPLALHGQVALAHRITGVGIADGLLAATVVFAAVVLPVNLFLLARRVLPGQHRAAGLASLLVPGIGFFPLFPIGWGSMTIIAGMAMTPAVAVAVERFLLRGGRAVGMPAVLASVGVFGTHSSEVALAALLVCSLLVEHVAGRGARLVPLLLTRGLMFALGIGVVLSPVLGHLSGGASERTTIGGRQIESMGSAIGRLWEILSFPSVGRVPVLLLGGAGAIYCLARRRHLPILALSGALLALFFVAAMFDGLLQAVTLPWYQQSKRIAFNLILVIPLFGGLLLARGQAWLGALSERRRLSPRTPMVAVVAAAGWIGLTGAAANAQGLHRIFTMHAMADQDAVEAFDYLASVTGAGDRVLIDRTKESEDGGAWMYAFAGVEPLLTLEPARDSESWDEREWLVAHLPELHSNAQVAALLDKYRVRYVYLNEQNWDGTWAEPRLDIEALRQSAGVCERFRQGSSQVLEIRPHGTCA